MLYEITEVTSCCKLQYHWGHRVRTTVMTVIQKFFLFVPVFSNSSSQWLFGTEPVLKRFFFSNVLSMILISAFGSSKQLESPLILLDLIVSMLYNNKSSSTSSSVFIWLRRLLLTHMNEEEQGLRCPGVWEKECEYLWFFFVELLFKDTFIKFWFLWTCLAHLHSQFQLGVANSFWESYVAKKRHSEIVFLPANFSALKNGCAKRVFTESPASFASWMW